MVVLSAQCIIGSGICRRVYAASEPPNFGCDFIRVSCAMASFGLDCQPRNRQMDQHAVLISTSISNLDVFLRWMMNLFHDLILS